MTGDAEDRNPAPFATAMGIAAVIVVLVVLTALALGGDPEAAGRLSASPIIAGVVLGLWAKGAERRWKWYGYGWRFTVCLVGVLFATSLTNLVRSRFRPDSVLTAGERELLVMRDSALYHPVLGFALPHPGSGYSVDNQIAKPVDRLPNSRNVFSWHLWRALGGEHVFVTVIKGGGRTQRAMREFGDGLRNTIRSEGFAVSEDTVLMDEYGLEFRMAAEGGGHYMRWRCLGSGTRRETPLIVCVQTQTATADRLTFVLDGLRIE